MFALNHQQITLRVSVTWQGEVSGLVGAALGQFQYTWLVKKRVIVAQTNVVLDLAGAARESGLFMYCFLLLISLVVAASILVPLEEDPRGVPSQAGKGIQGHLLQQDQLSWRGIYQALLLKHSQDSGGFHTWCVISARRAFGTCRLQQMILIVPASSSQRVFPIQSVF